MPSQVHEVLIDMFRSRPSLAAELLDGPLHDSLPAYDEAHLASADLTDVAPTEYRADAVVTLTRMGEIVFAVVVEVQRRVDKKKRRSWPVYVTTLHARLGCPVDLLIVCTHQKVADWAAEPITISLSPSAIHPLALGPAQTPVVTDVKSARRVPELAVLSILAHATRSDPIPRFEAFLSALDVIETERAFLYHDFVLSVLPAAARKLLEDYMTTTDYPFQSEFAKRNFADGKQEGRAEAKAQDILTILDARGVTVADKARKTITDCVDLEQLDRWIRRAATAARVEDLDGSLGS
ncbi:hypothetical protein Aph02nite_57770 [Actinoplanes philippinensis]|uniref:Transposase, YhgA-like n=1 Tax=Actinoplanes philippinensis TaxID=35752 RepID=A0A1I2J1I1_9ACTN|nr:hypothetical protein [Actinoplanes philippinensis]GIE79827.1 hypothetical protein Aph02nite_57770 [Actinoplanes philippinensis]SFF47107.1 hypothetical protein SAMN05421541_11124 [Actinoplanes philippinensis]